MSRGSTPRHAGRGAERKTLTLTLSRGINKEKTKKKKKSMNVSETIKQVSMQAKVVLLQELKEGKSGKAAGKKGE